MKRKIFICIVFTLFCFCGVANAVPYTTYGYNYWLQPLQSPDAYYPSNIVDGNKLGINSFKEPKALTSDNNNNIYISDSGNNRIICLDKEYKVRFIIDTFQNNGNVDSLKNPNDVFIDKDNNIFVADTDNGRIVKFDKGGKLIRVFAKPKIDLLEEKYNYRPIKFVLDNTNRFYVIAQGLNYGIMELSSEGEFKSFLGANKVIPDLTELFWRKLSSKKQKEGMVLFVPTEYNNIAIDKNDFLYVTSNNSDVNQRISRNDSSVFIRKLNLSGTDILTKEGNIPQIGDLNIDENSDVKGLSSFVDATMDDNGIYNILDSRRGRIFTYDSDGNLLYAFGGLGAQNGVFDMPNSIIRNDNKLLVLDKGKCNITVFNMTEYGMLLNRAIKSYKDGKYDESSKLWNECLKYNSNLELIYIGIGKNLLRQNNYKEAMENFKLGNSRIWYSKAFKLYRTDYVEKNIGKLLLGLISLIVLIKTFKYVYKKRLKYKTGKVVDINGAN